MSATTQSVGMKRALAFPEDEMPTPLAPAAGMSHEDWQAAATDPTTKVKERVKELETLLVKARAELQESEAEKYKIATPDGSNAPSIVDKDEIGADDMVKSPGVEPPPGIAGEDDGEERGQSSQGHDPMQEPQNDAWNKAKEQEGNQPPAWVMDLILQQNATMKDLQEQIKELKGDQSARTQAPLVGLVGANLAEKPIAPMDRKILDKPGKYDGNVMKFPDWSEEFTDYLGAHDDRWRMVLETIATRKVPIDEQEMLNIAMESKVGSQAIEFSKQLHAYLKAFTSGNAHRHVTGAGRERVFEVWRQMMEVGRSRRPEHVFAHRNRCNNPARAASLATLVNAINEWEADRNISRR